MTAMLHAGLWQHVIAIAVALVALAWLVRRALKGGGKSTGPCASCPASRHGPLATVRSGARLPLRSAARPPAPAPPERV
jgi:hypothetical protein